jgi:penicillin-binding protein 1A
MAKVLKGVPERPLQQPEGILVARINPDTGLRESDAGGIPEYFYAEFPPQGREDTLSPGVSRTPGEIRNQLF